MSEGFSQNLVLLRKEKGYSQKKVAGDLKISQALLSHYEKGIRECGLEFVVKTADYFNVSCDFLLGRSTQRTNGKSEKQGAEAGKSPEEKAVLSSVSIVFAILKKINSKSLTKEITNYLCCAVYTIIRLLTSGGEAVYKLPKTMFAAVAASKMTLGMAKSRALLTDEGLTKGLPTAESFGTDHPAAPAMQELVRIAESE